MQSGGLRVKGIVKSSFPDKPLISVVTVVYNRATTLEYTIRSVVNQTYDNVEFIIIDGKSTDGTLNVIKKYEDEIDWWQSESDNGIYDAMNKALNCANGDFLLVLGSDDLFFSPHVLKTFVDMKPELNENYYGDVYFSEHRYIYNYKFNRLKLCSRNICQQAIFYCKKTYKNHFFDTKYPICADYAYNIKVWNDGFKYIPLTISIYSELGVSKKGDEIFKKDRAIIVKKCFGRFISFLSIFTRCFYFFCDVIRYFRYYLHTWMRGG